MIHPELYPKKENDKENKETQEEPPTKNKEQTETAAEPSKAVEAEFQTQRGGGRGRNNKRIVSHWNAIRDNRVINTENKFRALKNEGKEHDEEDSKATQKIKKLKGLATPKNGFWRHLRITQRRLTPIWGESRTQGT